MTGEHSEFERKDDSVGPEEIADMLDDDTLNKLKAIQHEINQSYNKSVEQQRKLNLEEVKNSFFFILNEKISNGEASFVFDFCSREQLNVVDKIEDEGVFFLNSVREMIKEEKQRLESARVKTFNKIKLSEEDSDFELNSGDEYSDDSDFSGVEDSPNKCTIKGKTKRCPQLLLDDAMKDTVNFDGWSDARITSFKNSQTKPNAYFYRFNAPGELQKKGSVSQDEHRIFMKRLKEFGANHEWGTFSKTIPGRVGYQCSNYYRQLIKDKWIVDFNYTVDKNGKLKFKRKNKNLTLKRYSFKIIKDPSNTFRNLPAYHEKVDPSVKAGKNPFNELDENSNNGGNHQSLGKRKANSTSNNHSSKRRRLNDEEYKCNWSGEYHDETQEPKILSDFVDMVTGDIIERPAISPFGHVLGYATWCKILRTGKNKNCCPFTRRRVTRRSLIKLTQHNYDDYKDQIINFTEQDKKKFN